MNRISHALSADEHAALETLWQRMSHASAVVDAPTMREEYGGLVGAFDSLQRKQYIRRDADDYRLTALGLDAIGAKEADALLEIANHMLSVWLEHYLDRTTRKSQLSLSTLASSLDVPESKLSFIFVQLEDAFSVVLGSWTRDSASRSTEVQVSERILQYRDIRVILEELRKRAEMIATVSVSTSVGDEREESDNETLVDQWKRRLSNNKLMAIGIVAIVALVGLAKALDAVSTIELFFSGDANIDDIDGGVNPNRLSEVQGEIANLEYALDRERQERIQLRSKYEQTTVDAGNRKILIDRLLIEQAKVDTTITAGRVEYERINRQIGLIRQPSTVELYSMGDAKRASELENEIARKERLLKSRRAELAELRN